MCRKSCCDHSTMKKGQWSAEEDFKLKRYIQQRGTGGNWMTLPKKVGLQRCGKSCRLRWLNYLRPNIRHDKFSEQEDRIICGFYANKGSKWATLAAQMPGRTDNDIKNHWNCRLKKKYFAKHKDEHNPRLPVATTATASSNLTEDSDPKRYVPEEFNTSSNVNGQQSSLVLGQNMNMNVESPSSDSVSEITPHFSEQTGSSITPTYADISPSAQSPISQLNLQHPFAEPANSSNIPTSANIKTLALVQNMNMNMESPFPDSGSEIAPHFADQTGSSIAPTYADISPSAQSPVSQLSLQHFFAEPASSSNTPTNADISRNAKSPISQLNHHHPFAEPAGSSNTPKNADISPSAQSPISQLNLPHPFAESAGSSNTPTNADISSCTESPISQPKLQRAFFEQMFTPDANPNFTGLMESYEPNLSTNMMGVSHMEPPNSSSSVNNYSCTEILHSTIETASQDSYHAGSSSLQVEYTSTESKANLLSPTVWDELLFESTDDSEMFPPLPSIHCNCCANEWLEIAWLNNFNVENSSNMNVEGNDFWNNDIFSVDWM